MAILNVTPDSFSDGGVHFDPAQAIEDGLRFVAEGADIVDVGGESTRPGSRSPSAEVELRRVLPVVEGLAAKNIVVSVDTRRAAVARACLDAGARIVNDTSALRDDPEFLPLVSERGVPVVLMHRRGISEEKYEGAIYGDVVEDVWHFLSERVEACLAGGVAPENIALDPGIGFGKTPEENLRLITNAGRFAEQGHAVVVGSSRKGFIGRLTGEKVPARRDPASVWLAVEAARCGASIVRVHDVVATCQALAIWAAMR